MKLHRIFAMILRYLFAFRHNLDKVSDAFYWPTVDLLLWGLTSTYLASYTPLVPHLVLAVVSGIVFWVVVWRGQGEITLNLLEEFWDRNLVNLFVSPLKFSEWLISFIGIGLVKATMSFFFAMGVAWILYQLNLFLYGFLLIPFVLLLIMTGWWFGFFVAGLIFRFGRRVQALAWTLIFVISPFCAVFYPLSTLPRWAQKVAVWIPPSHVFEGMREVIATGHIDSSKLWWALSLNVIYLVIMFLFLKASFKNVLQRGLVKTY